MTDPQPGDGFDVLGHRPLSLQHSIRLAHARSQDSVRLCGVHALVKLTGPTISRAALDAMLADARQTSHDRVIAIAGAGRLTGVTWLTLVGEAAADFVRGSVAGEDPDSPVPARRADDGDVDQLLEALEHFPGSVLVFASCLVDVRASRAVLS